MHSPATHLSDFSIDEELGQGSFGTIFKVTNLSSNSTQVIKKINLQHLPQAQQKEVIQEAEILKQLIHPHIVKYQTSFIEDNHLCIVMEYIDGGDLQKLIKSFAEKKLSIPENEIWRIFSELSSAVEYLHSRNIIHRDIKTLNVLVTKNLTVKLADLGTSKIVSQPMQLTHVGTPLYLAPELVKHRPYDYKVDIWALGCVIYSLAKLSPPFQADNLFDLGNLIITRTPEPIPSIYSQKLTHFITRMLSKLPSDRPSIAAIIAELSYRRDSAINKVNVMINVDRNSPIVDSKNFRLKSDKNTYCGSIGEEEEPVICKVFKHERATTLKAEVNESRASCERERPGTASRHKVKFRVGSQRPSSASGKRNPLFNPREVYSLRIPAPCVDFSFKPQKAPRKHISISDLYF